MGLRNGEWNMKFKLGEYSALRFLKNTVFCRDEAANACCKSVFP